MKPIRALFIPLAVGALVLPPTSAEGVVLARPQCIGTTPSTCSTTFQLNQRTYPFVSHADFHETFVDGEVILEWSDSHRRLIVRWVCVATSVASTNANGLLGACTARQFAEGFYSGTQTLEVIGLTRLQQCETEDQCTFHGGLRFGTELTDR